MNREGCRQAAYNLTPSKNAIHNGWSRGTNLLDPANPHDADKMMAILFAQERKQIVCNATRSALAVQFSGEVSRTMDKPLETDILVYADPHTQPAAKIKKLKLNAVIQRVITLHKVLEYAMNYITGNKHGEDGKILVARFLFEEATDSNFYVEKAVNPAHQYAALLSILRLNYVL